MGFLCQVSSFPSVFFVWLQSLGGTPTASSSISFGFLCMIREIIIRSDCVISVFITLLNVIDWVTGVQSWNVSLKTSLEYVLGKKNDDTFFSYSNLKFNFDSKLSFLSRESSSDFHYLKVCIVKARPLKLISFYCIEVDKEFM